MKIRVLSLLLILSIGLFMNCSNDVTSQTETLNGIWNLKNVYGGLQGLNINYDEGDVKWNFNLKNSTLIVENNIITTGPEDIYAGLNSGTYSFKIEQNSDTKTLFINDTKIGVIILTRNNLKIDEGLASDGFVTEFER